MSSPALAATCEKQLTDIFYTRYWPRDKFKKSLPTVNGVALATFATLAASLSYLSLAHTNHPFYGLLATVVIAPAGGLAAGEMLFRRFRNESIDQAKTTAGKFASFMTEALEKTEEKELPRWDVVPLEKVPAEKREEAHRFALSCIGKGDLSNGVYAQLVTSATKLSAEQKDLCRELLALPLYKKYKDTNTHDLINFIKRYESLSSEDRKNLCKAAQIAAKYGKPMPLFTFKKICLHTEAVINQDAELKKQFKADSRSPWYLNQLEALFESQSEKNYQSISKLLELIARVKIESRERFVRLAIHISKTGRDIFEVLEPALGFIPDNYSTKSFDRLDSLYSKCQDRWSRHKFFSEISLMKKVVRPAAIQLLEALLEDPSFRDLNLICRSTFNYDAESFEALAFYLKNRPTDKRASLVHPGWPDHDCLDTIQCLPKGQRKKLCELAEKIGCDLKFIQLLTMQCRDNYLARLEFGAGIATKNKVDGNQLIQLLIPFDLEELSLYDIPMLIDRFGTKTESFLHGLIILKKETKETFKEETLLNAIPEGLDESQFGLLMTHFMVLPQEFWGSSASIIKTMNVDKDDDDIKNLFSWRITMALEEHHNPVALKQAVLDKCRERFDSGEEDLINLTALFLLQNKRYWNLDDKDPLINRAILVCGEEAAKELMKEEKESDHDNN